MYYVLIAALHASAIEHEDAKVSTHFVIQGQEIMEDKWQYVKSCKSRKKREQVNKK